MAAGLDGSVLAGLGGRGVLLLHVDLLLGTGLLGAVVLDLARVNAKKDGASVGTHLVVESF